MLTRASEKLMQEACAALSDSDGELPEACSQELRDWWTKRKAENAARLPQVLASANAKLAHAGLTYEEREALGLPSE